MLLYELFNLRINNFKCYRVHGMDVLLLIIDYNINKYTSYAFVLTEHDVLFTLQIHLNLCLSSILINNYDKHVNCSVIF